LARLTPAVAERRPDVGSPQATDPETERYLLMNAVVAVFGEAARRAPVVFVIDDLHWADKPTLVTLRHLLASAPDSAITVLGTYRQTDLAPDTPLVDVLPMLRSEASSRHIALRGLTIEEVLDLTGADGDTAAALHRETGGNPLFASELIRHLRETGTDLDAAGVPDTVRGLVARRVARLGDDVRSTLVAASVLGQEFDLELLTRVLDRDPDAVLDALERAESAVLVQTIAPGRFAFAHTLVQHSLYGELAPTRRARLHLAVAESIEAIGPAGIRIAELARHAIEGAVTTSEVSDAIAYATAAGDHALASLAPDEAVRWYRQTLELQQRLIEIDDEQRCRLLVALAEAQLRAGDQEFRRARRAAAELALRLGDPTLIAAASLVELERGITSESDPEVTWLLNSALEHLPDEDRADRAKILVRIAYESTFTDPELAAHVSLEAVAMARRLDDPATLSDVLVLANWQSAWLGGRVQEVEEAFVLAEQLGDPSVVFRSAYRGIGSAIHTADIERADRMLELIVRTAAEIGRPDFRTLALNMQGSVATLHGDLAVAESFVEATRALGTEIRLPGTEVLYHSALVGIRWQQGRQAELAGLMAGVADDNPQLAILRLPLSLSVAEPGDDLTAVVRALPRDAAWPAASAILSDIVARRGDEAAAALLYDMLAPNEKMFVWGGPVCRGSVAHALGALARTLGDLDAGDAHFAHAAAMHERMRAPFFLARTWLEWSALLLERGAQGDAERSREMLVDAREIARERGFAQIERRAERALDVWRPAS
jgi:hypothetical protein